MPAAALQRAARAAQRLRAATTTAAGGVSTAAAAALHEPRAEPHAKPHARHHAKGPAPPPPRAHGTLHVEELGFGRAGALSPAAAATAHVPTAVVLHGLLGAGRNLQSFSKQLLERAARAGESDWRGLLLDLRCHGRSAGGPGLEGPHALAAAAADVARTLAAAGAGAPGGAGWLLVGHSLGGKVGLELVRQLAEGGELAGAGLAPPR
jgi:pimeloyl-ACP methyl ester carboxylesterase